MTNLGEVGAATPEASLIICSRNRPGLLLDTVNSVFGGEQLPSEIVVIDQSDLPHPVLLKQLECRGCQVRYDWSDSRGASAARNAGGRAAQHDVLVFLDDDMIVESGWLGALLPALVRLGPHGVVTGQVAPAAPGEQAPSIKIDPAPAVYEGRTARDILYTGNMALYRATFMQAGGFDERLGPGTAFPAAEDNDLGFRLLQAGHPIAYVPEAVVTHRDWRSTREHLTLRWRYGRGQGAFYVKHLDLKDWHMLRRMLRDLVVGIRSLPKLALVQPSGAARELVYMIGLLAGAAGWFRTASRLPSPRQERYGAGAPKR